MSSSRLRKRIVITANDLTGLHASGRGLRALGLAEALAAYHNVCLLCPGPLEVPVPDGVATATNGEQRRAVLAEADIVVTSNELSGRELASLGTATLVADMYDPLTFELPWMGMDDPERRLVMREEVLAQRYAFRYADLILCANETQRDLYLGARLTARPVSLDDLATPTPGGVVVVPNGISTTGPQSNPALRGDLGIMQEDLVFIWGGGVWGFLDPELALQALLRARTSDPRLKLLFLGLSRELPVPEHEARLLAACRAAGEAVVVNERWVPASARGSYLSASTAGLLAQHPSLEAHFSFRTRLVDCLWARLPVLATGGDPLTTVAAQQGWALVTPPRDVEGLAGSMVTLANTDRQGAMRDALEKVRPSWTWPACAAPLVEALDRLTAPTSRQRLERAASSLAFAVRRRSVRLPLLRAATGLLLS